MNTRNYIGIVCIALLANSCKPADHAYTIRVENNTSRLVYYIVGYNYPNTDLPPQQGAGGIEKNSAVSIDSKETWQQKLGGTPGGKISVFFVEPDSVARLGWDTVRARHMILSRKDATASDLVASHYVITYP